MFLAGLFYNLDLLQQHPDSKNCRIAISQKITGIADVGDRCRTALSVSAYIICGQTDVVGD